MLMMLVLMVMRLLGILCVECISCVLIVVGLRLGFFFSIRVVVFVMSGVVMFVLESLK